MEVLIESRILVNSYPGPKKIFKRRGVVFKPHETIWHMSSRNQLAKAVVLRALGCDVLLSSDGLG